MAKIQSVQDLLAEQAVRKAVNSYRLLVPINFHEKRAESARYSAHLTFPSRAGNHHGRKSYRERASTKRTAERRTPRGHRTYNDGPKYPHAYNGRRPFLFFSKNCNKTTVL